MDISEIIFAIVLGAVAGFVARALLPGKQSMGLVLTIILGIVGSFVGYLIFTELLGIGDDDALDFGGIIGAIIGAMLVLFLYERTIGAGRGPTSASAPVEGQRRERGGKRRR